MEEKYFKNSNLKNLNVYLQQNKNIVKITPDKRTNVLVIQVNEEKLKRFNGNESIEIEVPKDRIKSDIYIYAGENLYKFDPDKNMIDVPIYIMQEEKTKFMQQLNQFGICYSNLDTANADVQNNVVKAVRKILRRYPELSNFIRILWIEDLGRADAKYTSKLTVDGLYGKVTLNSNKYLNPSNEDMAFLEYSIYHEFGHALMARLAIRKLGVELGNKDYNNWILHLKKTAELSEKIITSAIRELGITYDEVKRQISKYAALTYDECFAESVALNLFKINSPLIYEVLKLYNIYK